jgi:hypothetical protein
VSMHKNCGACLEVGRWNHNSVGIRCDSREDHRCRRSGASLALEPYPPCPTVHVKIALSSHNNQRPDSFTHSSVAVKRWSQSRNINITRVLITCHHHVSSSRVIITCHHHVSSSRVLITCPHHVSSSRVIITCPHHVSSSRVIITCPHHVSSSRVLITCPHHVSSSRVLITCHHHVSSSRVIITLSSSRVLASG